MVTKALALAAVIAAAAQAAEAMTLDWRLVSEFGVEMGGFRLDFLTPATVAPAVSGDLGLYTLPSFTFLGSPDTIGHEVVQDYILIFSPESGRVYHTDFGGGESSTIRVNDSAIRIGTLDEPLSPGGGAYAVIIEEVYSIDETTTYCVQYEEIYDDEAGEYTQTNNCVFLDSFTSYNVDSGYWYYGTLSAVATTASGVVPTPAAIALLPLGLAALAVARRRRRVTS